MTTGAKKDCVCTWLGDQWFCQGACPPGQSCQQPGFDGSQIGQQEETDCGAAPAPAAKQSPVTRRRT